MWPDSNLRPFRFEPSTLTGLRPTPPVFANFAIIAKHFCSELALRGEIHQHRHYYRQMEIRRCRKPVCAVSPKRTTTGQRIALCPCRGNHPEFKSRHAASLPTGARRLRSVEVIQIDLAGLCLGNTAARDDNTDEGTRHRRGENSLTIVASKSAGAGPGHLALSAWSAEGGFPSACYALAAIPLVPRFSDRVR